MKLTTRQIAVLDAIRTMTACRSYPPSIVELAQQLGLSPTRVRQHLVNLESAGAITRETATARSITIREPP